VALHTRRELLAVIGAAGITLFGKRVLADSAGPYSARVLGKKPVGYWRLNEQSGLEAHDATMNGHTGSYKGGVLLGQTGPIRSEPTLAIGVNGTTAFVEIPDSAAFSQPTSGQGLTVEAWMRPDSLVFAGQTAQKYVHWLGKGERGAFEWGFRFYSQDSPTRPNRISAYIWNPTSAAHAQNEGAGAYFQDVLQPGVWIHIVACYDPGDASNPNAGVSIYKNGVLRENPSKSPGARYSSYNITPAHGSAPLRLGTRDLGSFLTGGLDAVAIYPRVLSAAEIMDNYLGAS
jgi:Concanavalin A-like lectin/glucanases superfamily